jgi:3-oxoacyl-[acyl-carrier-protein] synthase-3
MSPRDDSEPSAPTPAVGIRSIGWWIPSTYRSANELADAYKLPREAVARIGLLGQPVAGDGDHPANMGARATLHALHAAGLTPDDLDLLIFVGVTRDWPAPWIAAFGVLHELGATRAAGFDLSNRCAGGIDALWLARALIDAGTYRHVAVCCAERFDYLVGDDRRAEFATGAVYSTGAATAIVSRGANNAILGFSNCVNRDLGLHRLRAPLAGGSRQPLDPAAVADHLHQWRGQLTVRELEGIAQFTAQADRHNYAEIRRQTGFTDIDFIACSPLNPEPQLRLFEELGVPRDRTMATIPVLGHIGAADSLLMLGIATAARRSIGRRIVMSARALVYCNALAILATGAEPEIAVAGDGIDVARWAR